MRNKLTTILLFVGLLLGSFCFGSNAGMEEGDFQPFSILAKAAENNSSQKINLDAVSNDQKEGAAWNLILVNRWNPIPDDYKIELTQLSNGESVATSIYPDLQKMFDAARSEGVYPVVGSGYRTGEMQQKLMDDKIRTYQDQGYDDQEAQKLAESWVAVMGTSEHELGLAVDINADEERSANEEVYEWLYDHSYQYGFILRYPADKTNITGTSYEPWHYRYVGSKAAKAIRERGVCLEEYLIKEY